MRHPALLLSLAAASVVSIAIGACAGASSSPTLTTDFASFNGARVAIVAEGGIAALRVRDSVEHDSRVYLHIQQPLCAPACGTARDSAAGTLPASTTDSLFSAVLAQKNAFRDDYGTTPNGADMMTYAVRITSDGSTKVIRADDGTMPAALRQLVDGVRAAIAAARR